MILLKTLIYGTVALAVVFAVLSLFDTALGPVFSVLGFIFLLGSVIWVYFDARQILGDQNGRAEMRSAEMWALLTFGCWGIFFFLYLIERSSLKRRVAEYKEVPAGYL